MTSTVGHNQFSDFFKYEREKLFGNGQFANFDLNEENNFDLTKNLAAVPSSFTWVGSPYLTPPVSIG